MEVRIPGGMDKDGAEKDGVAGSESLRPRVVEARSVIREAFERYSLEEVGFAFNGGKDCCVVSFTCVLSVPT